MITRRSILATGCAISTIALGGIGATRREGGIDRYETVRRGAFDEPVHREQTVVDENVRYAGDGEVEIVAAISGGEPISYRTEPFDEWAEAECGTEAAIEVAQHVRKAFDRVYKRWETVNFDFGDPIDPDLRPGVIVEYHVLTDDGEVLSEPSIEYDALVDATPKTASAAIEFESQSHEATFPVWVQQVVEEKPEFEGTI